ncbi:hypothetical protein R3P38DRAFT_3213647 [Favolaschia claudopus]|uniref:Uncharacterized protein n=1 Tax=Favolaschia claudopus TaxID=2862362 RepID=A0AAW0ADE1_9AGAR
MSYGASQTLGSSVIVSSFAETCFDLLFTVLVEPLSKPKVLLTRSDLEEYRRAQDDEEASDAEEFIPYATSLPVLDLKRSFRIVNHFYHLSAGGGGPTHPFCPQLRTSSNLQAIAVHSNWGRYCARRWRAYKVVLFTYVADARKTPGSAIVTCPLFHSFDALHGFRTSI